VESAGVVDLIDEVRKVGGHLTASTLSDMTVGTETAAEASSSRGDYTVPVASESNAADAHTVFRTLQTKFPKQLGKREPIVRRTDLGPERIYYRTMVGPFASMEDATRKAGVPEGDRLRRPTPRGLESRKNPCFFCPPALRTDFGSFRLAVATGVLLNSSSDLQDTTLILNI